MDMTPPKITAHGAEDKSTRIVPFAIDQIEPINGRAGGYVGSPCRFIPKYGRVRFHRPTIDGTGGWDVSVSVNGPRLKVNGEPSTRGGAALWVWVSGDKPSPPVDEWPEWVQAIVDRYHPDQPGDRVDPAAAEFVGPRS